MRGYPDKVVGVVPLGASAASDEGDFQIDSTNAGVGLAECVLISPKLVKMGPA